MMKKNVIKSRYKVLGITNNCNPKNYIKQVKMVKYVCDLGVLSTNFQTNWMRR